MVLAILVVVVLTFALAAFGRYGLALVGPAVLLVVALIYRDPPHYDMPGFGRDLALAGLVVALAAWCLGAVVSRWRRPHR